MSELRGYVIRNGFHVFLPFFSYILIFKDQLKMGMDYLTLGFWAVCFYLWIIFSVFYFLLYQKEQLVDLLGEKLGHLKFLAQTLAIVIVLSFTFASYYWCIYDFNRSSFIVTGATTVITYTDFLYYSFGIFVMNNNSDIQAISSYAKLFTATEMLSAFCTLILVLTNYKDLRKSLM